MIPIDSFHTSLLIRYKLYTTGSLINLSFFNISPFFITVMMYEAVEFKLWRMRRYIDYVISNFNNSACHKGQFSNPVKGEETTKWYIQLKWNIIIIIIIIIIVYVSWSWATCWPVPVSRIQKALQRSTMIPSASWGVVFHYPG